MYHENLWLCSSSYLKGFGRPPFLYVALMNNKMPLKHCRSAWVLCSRVRVDTTQHNRHASDSAVLSAMKLHLSFT